MKRWFAALLAAVLVLSLAACGTSDKDAEQAAEAKEITLTGNGVSITLPEGYSAVNDESQNTNVIAAFSGEDGYVGIYVTRETLNALGKDETYTAEDYVSAVRAINPGDNLSQVKTKDGIPYFTYTEKKQVSGKDVELKYLLAGYRAGDSCYLAQFFCYEQHYDDYFRDRFLRWAASVKFE